MRFTADRAALEAAIGHAAAFTYRGKNVATILGHLLLDAQDGALRITATNLDMAGSGEVSAAVEGPGAVAVPGQKFAEAVKLAPAGGMSFTLDGARLSIRAGAARYTLPTLEAASFPPLGEPGAKAKSFTVPAKALGAALRRVSFAISHEETRYYLCGAFLHQADGRLVAVATDGHRLSLSRAVECDTVFAPGIVPEMTVRHAASLCEAAKDGDVEIRIDEAKIAITGGGLSIVSKLIDGDYPDYARVIPGDSPHWFEADRAALIDTARRALVAAAALKDRTMIVAVGDGVAICSASDPGISAAFEETLEIDGEGPQDGPVRLGLNAKYVVDALSHMESERIRFAYTDSASPMLVTGQHDEGAQIVLIGQRV